jgi:Bacterial regulatory proteins, tetR family
VDDTQRRGRILGAPATCMAEKGYRTTTVADVARVARVSKTVLHARFRDEEDCLLDLVPTLSSRRIGRTGSSHGEGDAVLPRATQE